jgi:hypothetical protein
MSTAKTDWQPESEDLALAKDMVKSILGDWDWISWNELLAFDVVLSVRMAPVGGGDLQTVDSVLRVVGQEDAERLLRRIYPNIKSGLCIITEILSGYDAILLGNITPPSTSEGESEKASPIVIYMNFNSEGEVHVMTIAAIDLQPLADQIRCAVTDPKPRYALLSQT